MYEVEDADKAMASEARTGTPVRELDMCRFLCSPYRYKRILARRPYAEGEEEAEA